MRAKEGLADYRYFPEPDLPPVTITDEYQAAVQAAMQELPSQKRARYTQLGLSVQVKAAGGHAPRVREADAGTREGEGV